ncbi:MAG: response regulator [Bacteriovoracaceae bacterium]
MGKSAKKILVIDDDDSVRELLVEVLQNEGYELMSATDGMDGMNILKRGPIPDLILMDLRMPQMDGETFRHLQLENSRWVQIPTILMTADDQINGKSLNMSAYLKKPIQLDELLLNINFCLAKTKENSI